MRRRRFGRGRESGRRRLALAVATCLAFAALGGMLYAVWKLVVPLLSR